MAITGITEAEYQTFLGVGGKLTVQLDRADFSQTADFESWPSIRLMLDRGFELPPTTIILDHATASHIYQFGDTWARVITHLYRNGGKIIYRRIQGDKYEATLELPPKGPAGKSVAL